MVSGYPTANTAAAFLGEDNALTTQSQSDEQGGLSKESSHHTEGQWVATVQEPRERRSQARSQQPDQTYQTSPTRQHLPEQNPTTAVADYAEQLRERMRADLASVQFARENERHPAAAPTTLPEQRQSLPYAREAATGHPGALAYTAIDRKAEYARQLRDQMAADEATRNAMEIERKKMADPSSSSVIPASGGEEADTRGGGRSVKVGGQVRDSKAVYAQQLREQMAAKENAQRAAKGRMEQSPSTKAGPGWIQNATEGREACRKRSNIEYAEQLRAQIASQNGINQDQKGQVSSCVELPKSIYQQQHRQWPEEVDLMKERKRGPELQRSWSGNQDEQGGNEAERSQRRWEGEETMALSQRETQNSLALER